jgi:glycosyltransferase involved in cell wall biosynthesis
MCLTLIRGLRERFDFSVYVPCGIDDDAIAGSMRRELSDLGVPVHVGTRVRMSRGGLLVAAARLALGGTEAPDLVHLHTEVPEATFAAVKATVSRFRSVPIVRTIHNSTYWPVHKWIGVWSERQLGDAYVAAVSKSAWDAWAAMRRDAGLSGRTPQIIPNGVSMSRVRPRTTAPPSVARLLFAGRFEPQKGADLLPEIVAQVAVPAGMRVHLEIVGAGSERSRLEQLAANPPGGWEIQLRPPMPALSNQLADYDLLVMPSRFEGLSVLAIESLLARLPVVATCAPGLREGFPTGYPWLCAPGDARAYAALLSKVLAVPETWNTVADGAHAFALSQFDPRVMCARYDELYAHALQASTIASAAASNV